MLVRFHPQAWIRDYAVECDPEGPTDFEVEDAQVASYSDESDVYKDHPRAPQWVKEWRGPFDVEVLTEDEP